MSTPNETPNPQSLPDPESFSDATLNTISTAASPRTASSIADPAAIAERDVYDDQRKAQFLGFRRWLVPSLFAVTVVWLVFVGAIVLREEVRQQRLSDAVIIALLGTATANVLGLLVIVLKSIFPVEFDREE